MITQSEQKKKQQFESYNQEITDQKRKLKKSFEYLEKFKAELKETKNQLFEDRTTLNNAFKQLNQMTRERKRIKKEIKTVKNTLLDNINGFSKIMSSLITTRIKT